MLGPCLLVGGGWIGKGLWFEEVVVVLRGDGEHGNACLELMDQQAHVDGLE